MYAFVANHYTLQISFVRTDSFLHHQSTMEIIHIQCTQIHEDIVYHFTIVI